MAEPHPPTVEPQPRVPETYPRPYTPLVALQTRLLLGGEALNSSNTTLSEVTAEQLHSVSEPTYTLLHTASLGERKTHWQGREDGVFSEQKQAWIQHTTSLFQKEQTQQFFQSTQGRTWGGVLGDLGIIPNTFTHETAQQLYDTYLQKGQEGEESGIQKFVKKVLDTHKNQDGTINHTKLQEDLSAIEWTANIFGNNSAAIISQLIDAEATRQAQPDQILHQANQQETHANQETTRVNNLTLRERQLLIFLTGGPLPLIQGQQRVEAEERAEEEQQATTATFDIDQDVSSDVLLQTTIYSKEKDQRVAAFENAWKERWEDPKRLYFQTKKEESPFSKYSSRGWKIHLAFEKGKEEDMTKFLYTSGLYFKVEGQVGTYFNGTNASGATIYIGSYDNMMTISEYIEQNMGQFLVDGRPITLGGKVVNVGSGSDIEVRPRITARFDVQKSPFGVMGGNGKYSEYGIGTWTGFGGMPLLSKYAMEEVKIEDSWNSLTSDQRKVAFERLKQMYDESKAEAIKDFGEEFLLGKKQETSITPEANEQAIIEGRGFDEIERVGWPAYREALTKTSYSQMFDYQMQEIERLRQEAQQYPQTSTPEQILQQNIQVRDRVTNLRQQLKQDYARSKDLPFYCFDGTNSKFVARGKNQGGMSGPLTRIYLGVATRHAPEAFASLLQALQDEEATDIDFVINLDNFYPEPLNTGVEENSLIIYIPQKNIAVMEKVAKAIRRAKQTNPAPWEMSPEEKAELKQWMTHGFKIPLDNTTAFVEMDNERSYDTGARVEIGNEFHPNYNFTRIPIADRMQTIAAGLKRYTPDRPGIFTSTDYDIKKRRKYMPGLLFEESTP